MPTAELGSHLDEMRDRSNRRREERARTRNWLAEPAETWESRERLAEVLLGDPVSHLASVQVDVLLTWCRGIRADKARRILLVVGITGLKTVGQLSDRQARHLAGVLRHGYHDQPVLPSIAGVA